MRIAESGLRPAGVPILDDQLLLAHVELGGVIEMNVGAGIPLREVHQKPRQPDQAARISFEDRGTVVVRARGEVHDARAILRASGKQSVEPVRDGRQVFARTHRSRGSMKT
jgi:hypothetical protein